MGNVGGGEILVILLAALIILGPAKLPEAARQVGRAMGELRKVTSGFQRELQDALKDSDDAEARKRGEAVAATRPVARTSTTTATTSATPEAVPAAPSTQPAPGAATTIDQAAAQIPAAPASVDRPSAPAGDDFSTAPGSDR